MIPGISTETTTLLKAINAGDWGANERLFALAYNELHALAHSAIRKERPGHILQTTALVHEAYLNLVPGGQLACSDRSHFFRVAGRAMRRILIREARKRMTKKRGGGRRPVSLDELRQVEIGDPPSGLLFEDLEAVDHALEKLQEHVSLKWMCAIVDLRFFVGMTFDKIGKVLGVSKAKVIKDWDFTKAWLKKELGD